MGGGGGGGGDSRRETLGERSSTAVSEFNLEDVVVFRICKPVVSIADLYNQYHGKGIHKSKPVEGGVAELER